MKRIIALLTLGVVLTTGNTVRAQNAQQSPLRTRVALINMVQILKQYKKFQDAEANLKAQIAEVEKKLTPMKNELMKKRADYAQEKDAANRDKLEREMKRLAGDMEEAEHDARKTLAASQGKLAVQIFREVEDAVKLFARVNDIELVLMYNDALNTEATAADFYNAANVQRKMTFSGLLPIHFDPRMDISGAVIQMLNERIPGAGAGAPAGQ